MTSSLISRASALILLIGGVALLFAPDAVLAHLVPDYPITGLWLGQLVGAAWLGLATLNWLNRSTLLGGIYGRPVVATNLVLYVVSALALVEAATRSDLGPALWVISAPAVVLAVLYGRLLLRGPLASDLGARDGLEERGRVDTE